MLGTNIVDWFEKHRYVTLVLAMLLVWSSLMLFMLYRSEMVMRDPCSICATQFGKTVQCVNYGGAIPVTKYYFPNGSETNNVEEMQEMIREQYDKSKSIPFNLSKMNITIVN